jgi:hypothetical protein
MSKLKASVCLIAAAPDLLTLCKIVLANMEGREQHDEGVIVDNPRSVIKKAEGGHA